MTQIRYVCWMLLAIPFVPILIWQGRRIRRKIPLLPEAGEPFGQVGAGESFRLLALGEATVAGVGVEKHKDGMIGHLAKCLAKQQQLAVTWNVFAKNGCTMERSLEELLPRVGNDQPDLIVIGFGGNDAFACTPPNRWAKYAHELIGRIRNSFPAVPIVFLNMPPIYAFPAFTWLLQTFLGGLVDLLGTRLEKEVDKWQGVYFCNDKIVLRDWLEKTPHAKTVDDFFSDGVHPSQMTYQLWAEEIAKFISEGGILRDD